jgi:23S rRNA U2552 (ribose-2'-O)-methylase RlmE/FtsJ
MVKKSVCVLNGNYADVVWSKRYEKDISELKNLNDILHAKLKDKKNSINLYHKNKKWDKFKKLSNDYELVFTSTHGCPSIAMYNPISRSYFKLWELLFDFERELNLPNDKPLTAVFLADAPGGFGEAFINFRGIKKDTTEKDTTEKDRLFAMSLKATDKVIPDWKFTREYCYKNNLKLTFGRTGTGSMYDVENIEELIQLTGRGREHEVDFITADGGFDFSSDFNNQEEMSIKLILCEIYAALKLQKDGGSFILKIYDIHHDSTIKLLYILKCFYERLHIVKPQSSRPANSEKYIVCTNYNHANHGEKFYENILFHMKKHILNYNKNETLNILDIPIGFYIDIIQFNRVYITQQILHIYKTIDMIETTDEKDVETIIKHQLKKAIKWCHKYDIRIYLNALKTYKNLYNL